MNNSIIKLLEKIEENFFDKKNVNQSAKIYFHLIDCVLGSKIDYLKKQQIIRKYIARIDEIYQLSFIEKNVDGDVVKMNLLNDKNIKKYSILKYTFKEKEEVINEFMAEAILNDYNNSNDSFKLQKIEIYNILTKEKIELTRKDKKLLLRLFNILIKMDQLSYNYSLDMESSEDDSEYIVAESEIKKKTKKNK